MPKVEATNVSYKYWKGPYEYDDDFKNKRRILPVNHPKESPGDVSPVKDFFASSLQVWSSDSYWRQLLHFTIWQRQSGHLHRWSVGEKYLVPGLGQTCQIHHYAQGRQTQNRRLFLQSRCLVATGHWYILLNLTTGFTWHPCQIIIATLEQRIPFWLSWTATKSTSGISRLQWTTKSKALPIQLV